MNTDNLIADAFGRTVEGTGTGSAFPMPAKAYSGTGSVFSGDVATIASMLTGSLSSLVVRIRLLTATKKASSKTTGGGLLPPLPLPLSLLLLLPPQPATSAAVTTAPVIKSFFMRYSFIEDDYCCGEPAMGVFR